MKSIKTKIGHLKMKRSKISKNFLIKKFLFTKQKALKKYRIYLKTKTIRPLIQSLKLNATYSPAILSFLKEGNNGRISGDYYHFYSFSPQLLNHRELESFDGTKAENQAYRFHTFLTKIQTIKEDNVIYECSSLNTIYPNSEINYPVDFDNDHLFYCYINN